MRTEHAPPRHLSAFDGASNENARVRPLISRVWPHAVDVAVESARLGVSSFSSFKVTVDGEAFHVKMACSAATLHIDEFAEEVEYATWASQRGTGPQVVYKDVNQGIIVTTFFEDKIPDWDEGAQEPKLSAMVRFMAAMNAEETAPQRQEIHPQELRQDLTRLLEEAIAKSAEKPKTQKTFLALKKNIALIAAKLDGSSYFPSRIHGDFHQNNFLYQPEGSLMVDWGRNKMANPMQELAYLSYFTNRGINELHELMTLYGPSINTSDEQAQVYLVLLHATLYAEEFLGLEPQRDLSSEKKQAYLWSFLQQDFDFFGLDIDKG